MFTNPGIAEVVVVVLGSLLGYAVVLGSMGFGKNGSGPEEDRHSGQMRISPLLFGCLLGTIVNLLCMAFVWWLLTITGLIG
ncbi:MAG: hypothetical protein KJ069_29070 [Anaerolineae bacterium]|nr:hypothetical protein [Anaerolineae bacterium]